MENLRRRTEREVADARTTASPASPATCWPWPTTCIARWRRSVAELREQADASVKALIEGVELTERELIKVLEKHGVKKFSPQGEKFDPNLHQAMYEVADPERAGRHRRAGHAGRLHDRRPRAAPGAGRRRQGRAEGAARLRQRQSAPRRGTLTINGIRSRRVLRASG